jgi:hypothetical protein
MSGPAVLPTLTPAQEAETNLPRILSLTILFHVLAIAFVMIRMYTRFIIVKTPKLDDVLAIAAAVNSALVPAQASIPC